MAQNKVMKLWTAFVTAFFALSHDARPRHDDRHGRGAESHGRRAHVHRTRRP